MAAFALYYNGKYELVEFSKSIFYDLTNRFHFDMIFILIDNG